MYRVGVRMLRKRDEHHRLQNDSQKGVKAENLWGPGCPKDGFVDSRVSLNDFMLVHVFFLWYL